MHELTFAHGGTGGAAIELGLLGVALLVVVVMIVRGNRHDTKKSVDQTDDVKE